VNQCSTKLERQPIQGVKIFEQKFGFGFTFSIELRRAKVTISSSLVIENCRASASTLFPPSNKKMIFF